LKGARESANIIDTYLTYRVAPKSKPVRYYQKIVLNRIKACQ